MPPGIDPNALIILVWGLAAIVMGWTWAPAFISALGGTRYSCGGSNDTNGMDPSPKQPDYSFWAEQLLALGYEPLGSGWMRIHFAGPEWSQNSLVRVFKSASKNTFAYMQMAPAPFYFWPGAIFATCLVDGGILMSDNNSNAEPHPDDACVRQGVITLKLADVEELHLATQEALRRIGRKADSDMSIETLFHAAERNFGPEARKMERGNGIQYLFVHGLIHVCVSTPTAYLAGIGHWSVPLSNLVLAAVLLFGESSQKRQYAQAVRAALRNRQKLPLEQRQKMEL